MNDPGFIYGRHLPLAWFQKRGGDMRLILVRVAICLAFAIFIFRIAQLQINEMRNPKSARLSTVNVRRDIVDRNGELLALNLPVFELCINGVDVKDPVASAANLNRLMPQFSKKQISDAFALKRKCAVLSRSVSKEDMDRIAALRDPGIRFIPREERYYPHGRLFAHVIGGINRENKGVFGIEKYLDDNGAAYVAEPLKLSVDRFVQQSLHSSLLYALERFNAIAAAGVVIDVKNGEVVALVSLPDFDSSSANSFALSRPHRNKVISESYEQGSVMKIFNHALAIEHGFDQKTNFDVSKAVHIGAFNVRDSHFYKRILSFDEAFFYSSNRASIHIADAIGFAKQTEFLGKLRFFERLDFELPGLAAPIRSEWTRTTGRTVSYGNGLAISLLHTAVAMNAIVGGGMYINPTILKRDFDTPFTARQVMRENTSVEMKRLLGLVITDGTGRGASTSEFVSGGKTGTMQKRGSDGKYDPTRTMTFFAASIPLESPRYTIVVMLDEPKNGKCIGAGCTAAPTAKKMLDELTPLLIR
ncbi:MAG: penicillin-binding protein 2 [Alphaproteobacteria bacterium]|nr:penicillin-binding protein 2 [Alphaproteobacteria bacterium]